MRPILFTLLVAAATVGAASFVPAPVEAQTGSSGRAVAVTNFPDLYRVEGEVSIRGPIRSGSLVTLRDVLVPPVGRTDSTRLVNAGTITTDGFANVVVALAGQVKGDVKGGTIGVLLVPEDETVVRALDEQGQFLLALEAKATGVTGRPAYFGSEPSRFAVAFPRYRVLLYNATDKTAAVTVYAYMTN